MRKSSELFYDLGVYHAIFHPLLVTRRPAKRDAPVLQLNILRMHEGDIEKTAERIRELLIMSGSERVLGSFEGQRVMGKRIRRVAVNISEKLVQQQNERQ